MQSALGSSKREKILRLECIYERLAAASARLVCLLFLFLLVIFSPAVVMAATFDRVALVIGNAAYKESPLSNPVNDARAMVAALEESGFHVVSALDADLKSMQSAVLRLSSLTRPNSTALVFYAGHGVQSRGRNYLIPVDAEITSEKALRYSALDLSDVLDELEQSGARVNIIILDACRNNPFEQKMRGRGRGLAAVDAARGTLIAYATSPGSLAADGEGSHGLYTRHLLEAIRQPNLKVEEVFKRVRIAVSDASDGAQVPWESSSLTGDFVFVSKSAPKSEAIASTEKVKPVGAPTAPPASRVTSSGCADLSGNWANSNEGPALCPPPVFSVVRTGANVYDVEGTGCGVSLRGTGQYKNSVFTVRWKMTPCSGVTQYLMDSACASGEGAMKITKSLFCADTKNTGRIQRTLRE